MLQDREAAGRGQPHGRGSLRTARAGKRGIERVARIRGGTIPAGAPCPGTSVRLAQAEARRPAEGDKDGSPALADAHRRYRTFERDGPRLGVGALRTSTRLSPSRVAAAPFATAAGPDVGQDCPTAQRPRSHRCRACAPESVRFVTVASMPGSGPAIISWTTSTAPGSLRCWRSGQGVPPPRRGRGSG